MTALRMALLTCVYSNGTNIFLKVPPTKAGHWSAPVAGESTHGPLPRRPTLPLDGDRHRRQFSRDVWYGTTNPTNSDGARWKVYYAQSFNAHTQTPAFGSVK